MKKNTALGCMAVALAWAGGAQTTPSEAESRRDSWETQSIGAPPSQPLASPGLYRSGNECAPDRAEAEWDRNSKFLGYACVRTSPNVR